MSLSESERLHTARYTDNVSELEVPHSEFALRIVKMRLHMSASPPVLADQVDPLN